MPETITITIRPDAKVESIYSDAHRSLYDDLGEVSIRRASCVEPTPDGLWRADMGPVGGPILPPTKTRQESLNAELAWLRENRAL